MVPTWRLGLIMYLVVFLYNISCAQVMTGTPPYQSFDGGPDVINLGNLNVHYSIPVFSRAGRGIPFNYALAYDSSIWTPVAGAWVPSSSWGLHRNTAAQVGYVLYTYTETQCGGGTGTRSTWRFTKYVDPASTSHSFLITLFDDTCTGFGISSGSVLLSDGSGLKIDVTWDPSAKVTMRSGEVITPQLMVGGGLSGNGTQVDSNGNLITSSTSGNITSFYDTLSATVAALTIDNTNSLSVLYKYTTPSGALAPVTVTYVAKQVQTNFGCSGIWEYGPISNNLVDKITLPDGSYYQFTYELTPPSGPNVTGRIASVRLPTGGIISYSYQGGNNGIMCTDGSTAGFTRTTPDTPTGQYWSYLRTGTSPAYTTTIATPNDPVTGVPNNTVIKFQGNYETERDIYQGAVGGTPLETVFTCYNGNGVANPSTCSTLAVASPFARITKFRQLNGGSLAEVDTLYDGYGSVTEKDEYSFGASTPSRKTSITYDTTLGNGIVDHPSSVIVQDGANNLKAKTTYAYDEAAPQPANITTQHQSVNCTGGFTKCRGNATTIKTYVTSSTFLTRNVAYYDTGTPYTSTDVNTALTTYSYAGTSCAGAFVTSVTLPLSLSKSFDWNCTGGVMKSATDQNGKISYVNYTVDNYFWRPESTKDPLLYVTNLSYPSLTQSEGYLNFNGTVSTVDGLTSLDSLGRVQYSQQKQAQGSSNYDTVKQVYDSFGRPFTTTMPYAGIAKADPPQGTAVTTTYYDALNRPIQITDGGGGIVNLTYNQNDVYQEIAPKPTPDTNTKRKQMEYDGLGRLTSVCEVTGGTNSGPCAQQTPSPSYQGYWTKYIYDTAPNVNSLTVTQNVQTGGGTSQTRTYIYDMLGRLTSETNPESVGTSYYYDSDTGGPCAGGTYLAGNLVKRVDAVGSVTCYSYDKLHRVLNITYPSGGYGTNTDKKYFVYDGATVNNVVMQNPKGRLAEAYTCPPSGSCTPKKTDLGFSYSARGEVTDVYESTPNSGGYYRTTASYWAHGGLNTLGLLNSSGGSLIPLQTYGVEGEGRPSTVSAATGQNPVTGVTYTTSGTSQPIGSLTQVTFGSSDSDSFQYDIATGRMTQYKFSVGVTPQTVIGNLTWNANGSLKILAITDQLNSPNSQTCNYVYDDLARVASANCGATTWSQTFSFDPFGNIKKTVPQGSTGTSFQPTYSLTTNRYQSVPGCTPAYDANGFATNDCARSYTWDSAGNPRSIDTVNLTYDALGRMIEQGSSTQIVYGATGGKLALMNGQALRKAFVPLPGGATAVYISTGLSYYRHSDWLGSGRLATTTTRTMLWDVAYAPYGETYASSGTVDANFTGQNQDTVSNIYDFLFREYNAPHGRWPWPDPAGLGAVSLGDPQTWNRYAYVRGNSLNSVDLLGLLGPWDDVVGSGRRSILHPGYSWNTLLVTSKDVPDGKWQAIITDAGVDEIQGTMTVDSYTWTEGTTTGGGGDPANNGNCGTTVLPRSLGISYGGNADAGAGYEGITATGSAGVGAFYNGNTGASTGAFAGGGATAYFFNGNVGAPKQQGQPFNFGGYAGVGPSVWISNAGGAPQLGGPFTTWSLNVGAGPVKASLQLSYGGGIWQLSVGLPIPYVSAGTPSISVSKLTTKTTTTSGCH